MKFHLYIIDRKKASIYAIKFLWIFVLLISIGFISKSTTAAFSIPIRDAIVVIDAGHGGMDQ